MWRDWRYTSWSHLSLWTLGFLIWTTFGLTHSQDGNKSSFLKVRKRNDSSFSHSIALKSCEKALINILIYFLILRYKLDQLNLSKVHYYIWLVNTCFKVNAKKVSQMNPIAPLHLNPKNYLHTLVLIARSATKVVSCVVATKHVVNGSATKRAKTASLLILCFIWSKANITKLLLTPKVISEILRSNVSSAEILIFSF